MNKAEEKDAQVEMLRGWVDKQREGIVRLTEQRDEARTAARALFIALTALYPHESHARDTFRFSYPWLETDE